MIAVMTSTKVELERELRDFYSKYGKDGVVTYAEARKWVSDKDRRKRLNLLLAFLTAIFLSALDDLEPHFKKFLTEVIGKETTFFGVSVDVEKILNRPWGVDDLYWLQRLEADVTLWNATIARDIKRAIHRGATLDEVLKQLDKRFKSIESVLEALGISESTAVGSFSRQDIFKELGVTKYQIYTRVDERRCETCGALHGVIFPISAFEVGVTASPFHTRCRCWEVPIRD